MPWDKQTKPPADFCPGKYCFHWVPSGGAKDLTGRTYSSFQEAITRRADWSEFPQGGCGCGFGICTRMNPVTGDHDWYEPNEPAMERDGLPWFYFIPSTDKLVQDLHKPYLLESQALWGRQPTPESGTAADGVGM